MGVKAAQGHSASFLAGELTMLVKRGDDRQATPHCYRCPVPVMRGLSQSFSERRFAAAPHRCPSGFTSVAPCSLRPSGMARDKPDLAFLTPVSQCHGRLGLRPLTQTLRPTPPKVPAFRVVVAGWAEF